MINQDFLANFINECLDQGHFTPTEMITSAQNQIEALDLEIKQLDQLRAKQNNYKLVIRHLGGSLQTPKKIRKQSEKPLSVEDQLDSYTQDLCNKICEFIQTNNKPVTMREIGDAVVSSEEFVIIPTVVKWLFNHGILARKEGTINREIVPGTKWDERANLLGTNE